MKVTRTVLIVRRFLLLVMVFTACCSGLSAAAAADSESDMQALSDNGQEMLEEALKRLDKAIENKARYKQERELRADSLRTVAESRKGTDRTKALRQLFDLYARVQTDSALHYLQELERMPDFSSHPDEVAYVLIGRAEMYAVMGLYANAVEVLEKVDVSNVEDDTRLWYFHALRKVYGWMADYTSVEGIADRYTELMQAYRDSIINLQEMGIGRNIVVSDRWLSQGKAEKALQLSMEDLRNADEGVKPYIFINLAEAHRQLGNHTQYVYYLTLAATSDIEHGITEYMALPILVRLLYDQGDIDRAYNYLICALEDANYCKARLRTVEATNTFPIIDRAYKRKEESQQRKLRMLNIALALFAILLAAVLLYLRNLTRKLHASRIQLAQSNAKLSSLNQQLSTSNTRLSDANQMLSDTNLQLSDANLQLSNAGRLKEEYIAYYLEQCRSYIDALEKYRRNLLRMAKSQKTDELLKTLKEDSLIEREQKRFYTEFDKAFLDLHPNFVANFNSLLAEESRIWPRHGEQLTTELRIFALIRLGVTGTEQIAHFLNYSITTIYNYRSRVRSASIYEKEEFYRRLMAM